MKKRNFRFFWEDPFRNVDKMMKGMFGEESVAVNIKDEGDALVLYADLPGFKKDEIDLDVNKDSVKLNAQKEQKEEEREEDYYRREFSRSSVARMVSLPEPVKPEETQAELEDGVLKVTMPKQEPKKKKKGKKVKIK